MYFSSHSSDKQYFSSQKIDENVVFLATTHDKSGLTRRELSCVVTRNETLSGYRNCILQGDIPPARKIFKLKRPVTLLKSNLITIIWTQVPIQFPSCPWTQGFHHVDGAKYLSKILSIQYSMYFGTENIPLSSSGGNLLQFFTSLMITFWIYPGYNLFQLVTLDWITADRLQQLLQGNHHKKDKY